MLHVVAVTLAFFSIAEACIQPSGRPAALLPEEQTARGLSVSGTLIVAGGSLVTNSVVFQRFLTEAGGRDNAKILYCPTNLGGTYDTPAQREAELNSFLATAAFGELAFPVELIHTYSRAVAEDYEFWSPIDEATAVYFAGGLPFRTHAAYKDTETNKALERLLERGGLIGGSSAGALMQSNVMCRGDASSRNHIVVGEPHDGFAFGGMHNIIFDVHNLHRNRAHDLIEAVEQFPDHLGISVDEDTSLVFKGDTVEVIGTGWAQVFDRTLWQDYSSEAWCSDFRLARGVGRMLVPNHGRSHFLSSDRGDVYNVRTRSVVSSNMLEDEDFSTEGF